MPKITLGSKEFEIVNLTFGIAADSQRAMRRFSKAYEELELVIDAPDEEYEKKKAESAELGQKAFDIIFGVGNVSIKDYEYADIMKAYNDFFLLAVIPPQANGTTKPSLANPAKVR